MRFADQKTVTELSVQIGALRQQCPTLPNPVKRGMNHFLIFHFEFLIASICHGFAR
jgi:hypothetical protein